MRKALLTFLVFGLIVAVTTYSNAQPGRGFGGGGNDTSTLIRNKSVQEEIKLTTEQKEKLDPKIKEMGEKQRELFGEFKGKFDEETRKEMATKMKEISEPFAKFVDETLTTDQKTRLKQIRIQRMGMRAFSDEEVAKALDLTDEQKSKIKTIADETSKETRELFKEMRDNRTEAMKKMTALNKEGMEKATEVLDKSQKVKFEEMTGKPFEYKDEFGPPRKGRDKKDNKDN